MVHDNHCCIHSVRLGTLYECPNMKHNVNFLLLYVLHNIPDSMTTKLFIVSKKEPNKEKNFAMKYNKKSINAGLLHEKS